MATCHQPASQPGSLTWISDPKQSQLPKRLLSTANDGLYQQQRRKPE